MEKDFESRLSLETNKIANIALGNKSDTNFRSEIKTHIRENKKYFCKVSERSLKRKMFKTGKNHIRYLPHTKELWPKLQTIANKFTTIGAKAK